MALSREQVVAALRGVQDPELFKDIVTLNMVKDVQVDGDRVGVTIELTTPACPMKEKVEADVRAALAAAGAKQIDVKMTANTRSGPAGAGSAAGHIARRHAVAAL
jgi:ATP-binding protein involved in chromosome partitioning